MFDVVPARNLLDSEVTPNDTFDFFSATTKRGDSYLRDRQYLRFSDYQRRYSQNVDWQKPILSKLLQYLELPNGWDSYTGKPLKHDTGMFALQILNSVMNSRTPEPVVVPVSTGGVQFEWHQPDFDLELYIAAPYESELWFEDRVSGESRGMSITTEFSELARQISRLDR
jgi:hypothetical protein